MSVLEGELLAGKYLVEREVARGGMGVVFAAKHTKLDQRVALKFLVPEGEASEDARIRFLREARAAVRLRSEHVARVLDVGTAEDGAPYIVMEYLEGEDLSDVLARRGRLPAAEAVAHVLQAAEAVAEAHALGIIHRDLKPANLFLTQRPDGSSCVKVLDFGISKALGLGSLEAGLTQAKAIIGTPHYMSPEQIRSSRSVDMRSDIWAMGMILYELVTGVVAFPRETLPELCSAIILDPIPPLHLAAPDLDEDLERAITQALAKAPENRPQTLAELALSLAPFTPEGQTSAARIARILKTDADAPLPAPSSQRLVVRAPMAPAAPPMSADASSLTDDAGRAEAPTERPAAALSSSGSLASSDDFPSTPLPAVDPSSPDVPPQDAPSRARHRLGPLVVAGGVVLAAASAAIAWQLTLSPSVTPVVVAPSGAAPPRATPSAAMQPGETVTPEPAAVLPSVALLPTSPSSSVSASAPSALPRPHAGAGPARPALSSSVPDEFGPRQ